MVVSPNTTVQRKDRTVFDTTQLKLYDHTQGPRKIGPDEGYSVQLPGVGVRFMAWTEETGGGFSLVKHPIPPLTLVAPLHRHSREDEYSFVLEAGVRPRRLREGDPRLA